MSDHSLAQNPSLESLTAADGLSQGMVFDLLQTRDGFLWFATKDGLNRYDGYSFRVYHNDPFNRFSISGNAVQAVFEDHLGRLWIGTPNNGADVLDPQTGKFYHFAQFAGQSVTCFAETPDGSVWLGTQKGVKRVKLPDVLPADDPDLHILAPESTFYWDGLTSDRLPSPNFVVDLAVGKDGKLWVSTALQVGWYDPPTDHFQTVWADFAKFNQEGEELHCFLFARPDGSLWMAHPDCLVHWESGHLAFFPLPERSPFPQSDLAFDAMGNVFVSTRKQIFTLSAAAAHSPSTARFDPFYRFPPEGIIGSTKMLIDRSGLLWIGTNGYGLRKYNPGDRHFQHFATGISLRRIAVDRAGRAWIWRSGGKFLRLDEAQNRLAEPLLEDPSLLQHDCLSDRNGALWLLCENRSDKPGTGVLIKINPHTLRPEARYAFDARIGILSQFIEDRSGKLRILDGTSTLITFDPIRASFETADFSGTTGFREVAYCLTEDVNGHFWIGTPHGLVRAAYAAGNLQFSLFKNNPDDRNSLNCNVVLATLDDLQHPDQFLWVGTKGGGLNMMDKNTGRYQHFTTAEGLPNNVVYAVVPDSSGSLWLSTNCGLAKFDPVEKRFQNFFATDGLQDNEFNTASFARASDDRLFFGGVNGLTAFYPQALLAATVTPAVLLTALKIQNHTVYPDGQILEKSIEKTSSIVLHHAQNQLTFEFAAMDFSAPQQNQYRYRMVGVDQDWVEPTTANSATYANLAPGKYSFQVRTGGSHGAWNDQATCLDILILPPWWKTGWAYLLYFLVLAGSGWLFYRFQLNRLRLQNELAFEHREADRLAELDRLKTNFFSSVTHEFRTPLTLILEPARQLLAEVRDEKGHYKLELIEKNARRLLGFVNQLLDISKLEAGQMPMDLRPHSPVEVVQTVAETFLPLAKQREVDLEITLPDHPALLVFDREKLEQIISNLLSNALKFTGKGGRVGLRLTIPDTPHIVLQVTDTGIGIPEAALPLIFDRFYQVGTTAVQGTGIGLALTKELVERMGGTITVDSQVGQGTTFQVRLPVRIRPEEVLSEAANAALLPVPPGTQMPGEKSAVRPVTNPTMVYPATDQHPLLLLIEDDDELRHFLRASLPPEYRVAEAANGAQGIQMALDLVPDLIISDLMMPEKNGFEVCDILKNDPLTSHVPLILLTAKSAVESKIQGLQRGADVYLTKPFRADELAAHMENLIVTRRHLQLIFSKTVAEQSVVTSTEKVFDPREHEFLQRLIAIVEENLDQEALDAETFARKIHMSRSQLHRKISALTGLALTEFVRNYRLDRAREMLGKRLHSITEIAWRTGFPNAKYFSTCFRERFGQSPSAFRSGAGGGLSQP